MAVSASTPKAVAHGIEDVRALKDQVVGPSQWREVTQEMINQFADLSGDHQWIHVDPERAKVEPVRDHDRPRQPDPLADRRFPRGSERLERLQAGRQLRLEQGRFPAPVVAGARLRCYAQIVEVSDVGGGWHQVVTRFTVETEGGEKPVCVADSVARLLVDDA